MSEGRGWKETSTFWKYRALVAYQYLARPDAGVSLLSPPLPHFLFPRLPSSSFPPLESPLFPLQKVKIKLSVLDKHHNDNKNTNPESGLGLYTRCRVAHVGKRSERASRLTRAHMAREMTQHPAKNVVRLELICLCSWNYLDSGLSLVAWIFFLSCLFRMVALDEHLCGAFASSCRIKLPCQLAPLCVWLFRVCLC